MEIRKVEAKDFDRVVKLFSMARLYLKENNIEQWQSDYPALIDIQADMSKGIGYVVVEDELVVAYFAFAFCENHNYERLIEGKWLNDDPYALLNRIVVDNDFKGQGIGSFIIDYSKKEAKQRNINSIRVDTHDNNNSMKRLALKNNFVYCGIIKVEDNTLRNTYQLLF
ncbi:MAG: GNAT family N-acetyltransferase [Erysipelotrichaceae bacterium]|nr:GNAT family N-acetyltransferase [Erysipelotrichaceae bacterium]